MPFSTPHLAVTHIQWKCSHAPVSHGPQRCAQLQKVVILCKKLLTFLINHLRTVNAHRILIIITPDLVIELVTQGQEPPYSQEELGGTASSLASPYLTRPGKQFGSGGALLLLQPLSAAHTVCVCAFMLSHTHKHTLWHAACWVGKFKHAITGENMPKQQI